MQMWQNSKTSEAGSMKMHWGMSSFKDRGNQDSAACDPSAVEILVGPTFRLSEHPMQR